MRGIFVKALGHAFAACLRDVLLHLLDLLASMPALVQLSLIEADRCGEVAGFRLVHGMIAQFFKLVIIFNFEILGAFFRAFELEAFKSVVN